MHILDYPLTLQNLIFLVSVGINIKLFYLLRQKQKETKELTELAREMENQIAENINKAERINRMAESEFQSLLINTINDIERVHRELTNTRFGFFGGKKLLTRVKKDFFHIFQKLSTSGYFDKMSQTEEDAKRIFKSCKPELLQIRLKSSELQQEIDSINGKKKEKQAALNAGAKVLELILIGVPLITKEDKDK